MTQAGLILGTAAYMSPEQVKGQPADKRSDVWAFGCVTYEMLTGIRAFSGEDGSDTRAAVLRDEPEWTRLPTAATPSLRALIQGCLQKDRRQCIADISSVRFLLSDSQINASIPRHPAQSPPFAPRVLAFVATAIIVGGIRRLGIWGIRSLRPSGAANVALRFAVTAPRGTSFGSR